MTTFIDGPAHGQHLRLRRAPIFLRVVVDPAGKWDALDDPLDEPKSDESIYAYQLTEKSGMMFVRASGGRGGAFVAARYRIIKQQPTDEQMRSRGKWDNWCEHQSG